jgi:hypothetical protein
MNTYKTHNLGNTLFASSLPAVAKAWLKSGCPVGHCTAELEAAGSSRVWTSAGDTVLVARGTFVGFGVSSSSLSAEVLDFATLPVGFFGLSGFSTACVVALTFSLLFAGCFALAFLARAALGAMASSLDTTFKTR